MATWDSLRVARRRLRKLVELADELQVDASANIAELAASVEALNALTDQTNAEINENPAVAIKYVARECKTITRQAVRIALIVSRDSDPPESEI